MNTQWIDILPPAPPAEPVTAWIWWALVFALIFIPVFHFWKNSTRQKCLRMLKQLHNQLHNTDRQNIPFDITRILKLRYGVNNIMMINTRYKTDWDNFCRRLLSACYSSRKVPDEQLGSLVNEACNWVKRKR